ncbi:MAG: hypothetical protein K2Y56_01170 [Methylobacterium sp.]|uniref:hypothetical protein n=1 Tax=Methylobacterium sp. TaxID=409 RepID=UPI0025D8A0DB|nr:hypothetical protein [Methylobacterium sp.]MBX9930144.1 hypothetical protein [Methylobacterium sp.]
MNDRTEIDPLRLVAEIADPELRARTARLWGLDHPEAIARIQPVAFDGPQSRLLAALRTADPGGIAVPAPDPEIAALVADLPQVLLCYRPVPRNLYPGPPTIEMPASGLDIADTRDDADVTEDLPAPKNKSAVTSSIALLEPLVPFRLAPWETGVIPAEMAIELVDAVSFLMQEHGIVPNALVTVHWEAIGVRDASRAARLAAELAAAMGDFVRREFAADHPDTFVLVHDAAAEPGLRTRVLAHVPGWLRGAFRLALDRHLRRILRKPPGEALKIYMPRRRERAGRVAFAWSAVRLMLATLDARVIRTVLDGERVQLARLLGLRALAGTRHLGDVEPIGVAPEIDVAARRLTRRGFFSAARRGAWHQIATGWELDEFSARTQEWANMHEWLNRLARHPHVDARVRVYVPRPGQGLVDSPAVPVLDPHRRSPGEHPNALSILYALDAADALRRDRDYALFRGPRSLPPIRLSWSGLGDPPEPDAHATEPVVDAA